MSKVGLLQVKGLVCDCKRLVQDGFKVGLLDYNAEAAERLLQSYSLLRPCCSCRCV